MLKNRLKKIKETFSENDFRSVILQIEKFLNTFSYFKDINYFSFTNSIEKSLYEKYIGSLDDCEILSEEINLSELYLIYSISSLKIGNLENYKKYLDIAYKVNPVSPSILFSLLKFYHHKKDFSKVLEFSKKIFQFTYDGYVLINTYKILAYYYLEIDRFDLYENLINFFSFFESEDEIDNISDIILFLEMNQIQIGFNPEIIDISREISKQSLIKMRDSTNLSINDIHFDFKEKNDMNNDNRADSNFQGEPDGLNLENDDFLFSLELDNGTLLLKNNLEIHTREFNKESFNQEKDNFTYYNYIFRHVINLNSYLKGLTLDCNLQDIIMDARLLITNEKYDESISKINEFFIEYPLDNLDNYYFFNNEIERTLYYYSSSFDKNFILLSIDKNYSYLYYLYGFSYYMKKDFSKAEKYYSKALKLNPFSVNFNLDLINVNLKQFKEINVDMLVSIEKIAYCKEQLSNIYRAFSKNLLIQRRMDDSELIETFADSLSSDLYKITFNPLNLRILDIFNEFNFNFHFDSSVLFFTTEILNNYALDENENNSFYENFYRDMLDFNEYAYQYIFDDVEIKETGNLLRNFTDDEISRSFILIKDKFDDRFYSRIPVLKTDFDEKCFDKSDSFLVFAYKQVNGNIIFIFLTTANMLDDGNIDIHSREYYYKDVLLSRDLLDDKEIVLLDEISQFKPYLNTSDDYSKWLSFNLTGDIESDLKFLLDQLKNIEDDIFDIKRRALASKLNKLIDYDDLLKKNLPSSDLFKNCEFLIKEKNYEMALSLIDQFLEEYPFLYFDGFIKKFRYFNNDFEKDLFFKLNDISRRDVIELPQNQNYSKIFKLKSICLLNLNDFNEALRFIEYSLKINPMDIESKIISSDIYLEEKNYDYALKYLKNSLLFNIDLSIHIQLYQKLAKIYEVMDNKKVYESLIQLSNLLFRSINNDNIELDEKFLYGPSVKKTITNIKNMITNENILLGFNPELITVDSVNYKINEVLFFGSDFDIIIQECKPFLKDFNYVVNSKLKEFLIEHYNSSSSGYIIPIEEFDLYLLKEGGLYNSGNVLTNKKYCNFRNDLELNLYLNYFDEKRENLILIPYDEKIVDFLILYSDSIKYQSKNGVRKRILNEASELNPFNCQIYLDLAHISSKFNEFVEYKRYIDKSFELAYNQDILIETYHYLSIFYNRNNLKEVHDLIENFVKKLENNSFEDDDLVNFKNQFKQYNIPFGFNEKLMRIVGEYDTDIYKHMLELYRILNPDDFF